MTDEERRIISEYVARVAGAVPPPAAPSGPWGQAGGSVPQTQAPQPLPPVDPVADQFIGQLFQQYPEARYRITQTAFIQEAALVEAQNRIRQLEWERDQARAQAQQAAQQQAPRQGGGFLGGLFGGGASQQRPAQPAYPPQGYAPPPQPQYPPGYNPQAFQPQPQQQGPSFLGGALRTAAGVAGGVVVGNMLLNAFSHHNDANAAAAAGGFGGGFGGLGGGGSPWTNTAAPQLGGGWDQGGGFKDPSGADKFAAPAPAPDATPANWGGDGNPGHGGDEGSGSGGGDWGGGGGGDDGGGDFGGGNDC